MLKILAVGNSFSNNTTHYLYPLAQAAGVELKVVNLFVGGCPLERHWHNIQADNAEYRYELNGDDTDEAHLVSIDQILPEERWDHIFSQQASGDSGLLDTYQPYAGLVYAHLRQAQPQAHFWMQETWAYDRASDHRDFAFYHRDQDEMFAQLVAAYTQTSREVGATLLPTGTLIQKMRALPFFATHPLNVEDGYHLNDYGKYGAALLWLQALAGVPADQVPMPDDAALRQLEPDICKQIAQVVTALEG
ncbi:DUF4886 domain-containing protein [Lacticaseibacillus mingshuiensis]|uniref:DUF4886 domain-containing protein n=1 Tax=Lacticaseibacillus mingshuiensis TaxID=2799574 RepID=A0ABW4CK53_9LACO|nr:DUF4886 domain-containing protein [Lacticaseibacillus mingshuiensis]